MVGEEGHNPLRVSKVSSSWCPAMVQLLIPANYLLRFYLFIHERHREREREREAETQAEGEAGSIQGA